MSMTVFLEKCCRHLRAIRGILGAAFVSICISMAVPAAAQQNLTVRPMKVEAPVPPNRLARVVIRIRNDHPTEVERLTFETMDLTQTSVGALDMVDAERRRRILEQDPNALDYSSVEWIELTDTVVEVAPQTTVEVPVILRVPPSARGTYASAVRVLTDRPETPVGSGQEREAFFAITFGFLIPIITPIEGRSVRQDVSLADVEMVHDTGKVADGTQVSDPTTRAYVSIVNKGRTYSSLGGDLTVERRSGENWRTVTRAKLPTHKILPRQKFRLPIGLDRRLPSGDYRLIANLTVDGRRLPRVEKEIAFEGDAENDKVAFDTSLQLKPATMTLEAIPGATRTSSVQISNPSDQPITVEINAEIPEGLSGVALGGLMGEDLSAAAWSEILPSSFTIRPGGRRNVRVLSSLPQEGVTLPNYYADIVLTGRYSDGQSAGTTRTSLHVHHKGVEQAAKGIVERLSIATGQNVAEYFTQLRFINTGTVHLNPSVSIEVLAPGDQILRRGILAGDDSPLLPLGIRDFGGELNLSGLSSGYYLLRATVNHDGGRVLKTQGLLLTVVEGGHEESAYGGSSVEMLDPESEAFVSGFRTLDESDD